MSEEKKETKQTKSLDELFAKKSVSSNKEKENDNLRTKMDRLMKANSIFDDDNAPEVEPLDKNDSDDRIKKLEEEKQSIEKELASANEELSVLYALKYNNIKVIDKKNKGISSNIVKELEKEVKLQDDLKALKEKVKKCNDEIEKANLEKQKLEENIALINANYEKMNNEKDSEISKNKDENNKNIALIEQLNKEIIELKNKKDELKDNNSLEYQKIEAKYNKALSDKDKLNLKINELQEKNKSLNNDIKNYKNESKNNLKEAEKTRKENEKIQVEKNALEDERKALNLKLEEYNSEKVALEEEIKKLNCEIDELKQRNELLQDVTFSLHQSFKNHEVKEISDAKEIRLANTNLEQLKQENEKLHLEQSAIIDRNYDNEINELNLKIEDLKQKLDSKDFEISQLQDEKNDLKTQNEVIPNLNSKIEELQKALDDKEKEYEELKQIHVEEDHAIQQSVYNELNEIQKECDKANEAANEAKSVKEGLEQELEVAYKALQEQENILSQQQEILNLQQSFIDNKVAEYKQKMQVYEEETKKYNKDRDEYQKYFASTSTLQDESFKKDAQVDELEKELNDIKGSIDSLKIENDALKEESAKNEDVIKQYLDEIHMQEARIDDLVDTIANKEILADNFKNKYNALQKEYEDYKENKNAKEKELEVELEHLRKELNSINSDNEKLSISKFNESRLQSRIFELENNIKVLSLKQENDQDNELLNSLDQYRNLLANERAAHEDSENKLTKQLTELQDKIDDDNKKLEKYSSNYYYIALNNQINLINSINTDIKNKGVDMNRDVYTKYYSDALKIYDEQSGIYKDEINKRNEMLTNIKFEKDQELQELSLQADSNVMNSYAYNKIRLLYKQIKDIDLLINGEIRTSSPVELEQVEAEIVKTYKKNLLAYHRQMEENIKNLEKKFNDTYTNIESLDQLIETYNNDSNEIAKIYTQEIQKLNMENNFDDNPLSKILREEKIMLLANEFQTLINLKDEKYIDVKNRLEQANKIEEHEKYNSTLVSYDALKQNISQRMGEIEKEANEAKQLILDEQKHILEDISHLNDQLNQLNSFGDDFVVEDNRKKVNVLLAGKQERLNYLTNVKAVETEKYYNELISQIKDDYNKVVNDEQGAKNLYEQRSNATLLSKKIKENSKDNNEKNNTYEAINKCLLNFDNVDTILDNIFDSRSKLSKQIDANNQILQEKQNAQNEFIEKYRNLWNLYDKYQSAKKTLEEDVEDIRTYITLKAEASGTYRKFIACQRANENLNERIQMGLDVNKNKELVELNNTKINTLQNKIDYLNKQSNDLTENQNVLAYVELTNKIDEIIKLIKQMEDEFRKYTK